MAGIVAIAKDHLAGNGWPGDYADAHRWAVAKLESLREDHALFTATSAFDDDDDVMVGLESDIDTLERAIAFYESKSAA